MASANSTRFPAAGLRVLVVDSDTKFAQRTKRQLERFFKYKVNTRSSARGAASFLFKKKTEVDVILCDVHVFDLIEVDNESSIPIVLMSSDSEDSVSNRQGACGYLVKPLRKEELRNLSKYVVGRKEHVSQYLRVNNGTSDLTKDLGCSSSENLETRTIARQLQKFRNDINQSDRVSWLEAETSNLQLSHAIVHQPLNNTQLDVNTLNDFDLVGQNIEENMGQHANCWGQSNSILLNQVEDTPTPLAYAYDCVMPNRVMSTNYYNATSGASSLSNPCYNTQQQLRNPIEIGEMNNFSVDELHVFPEPTSDGPVWPISNIQDYEVAMNPVEVQNNIFAQEMFDSSVSTNYYNAASGASSLSYPCYDTQQLLRNPIDIREMNSFSVDELHAFPESTSDGPLWPISNIQDYEVAMNPVEVQNNFFAQGMFDSSVLTSDELIWPNSHIQDYEVETNAISGQVVQNNFSFQGLLALTESRSNVPIWPNSNIPDYDAATNEVFELRVQSNNCFNKFDGLQWIARSF